MPNITDLPTELISQILETLSFDDIKSLRFVSHHCSAVCASLLFRCIRFSRLKRHHDAFFAIADCPHLAQAVHKLVWEELDIDACEQTGTGLNWTRQSPGFALDNDESYIHELYNNAKTDTTAFWLPRGPYCSEEPGAEDLVENRIFNASHNDRLAEVAEVFHQALQKMPNLSSFISCPMPPDRSLTYQRYDICADTFVVEQTVTRNTGSLGLRQFLLTQLSSFPSITALHIGTELTTLCLFDFWNSKTYQNLTTLDLCIAGTRLRPLHDLYRMFMATPFLVSLKLCFERMPSYKEEGNPAVFPISSKHLPELKTTDLAHTMQPQDTDEDSSTTVFWPHLTTLHLVDVRLPEDFDTFLGKHASSLRTLVLDCCHIDAWQIHKIRRTSRLGLSSIRVLDADHVRLVEAGDLLAYINNETDVCLADGEQLPTNGARLPLMTENPVFDHHTCHGAAYFESRTRPEAYHDADLYVIYGSHDVPEDIDLGPEETSGSDADDDTMDELLDYKAYKARRGRVYWDWCYHNDTWYWWAVNDADSAKTETSNWLFRSRNREVAYGPEPLAYFDDWDSDAGDIAEPTPFGKAFDKARQDPASASGSPPEGADNWVAHDVPSFRDLADEARRSSPDSVYNLVYEADMETHSQTEDEEEEEEEEEEEGGEEDDA